MNFNLLLDIGNSNIKIAKAANNKILNVKRFDYAGSDFLFFLFLLSQRGWYCPLLFDRVHGF